MIAFDSTKIIESVLNVVYPLNDVILLSLILGIFFSTQTGRFSITWRLLGFGFLIMTISDLMFSYTSWFGIYYPDDQPNIISIVLDVLYYNSYLLMAIGMFAFGLVLEMERGIRIRSGSTALTRSSILLFVDKNLQIISFSDNFLWLVNDRSKWKYLKLPLNQALRIDTVIVDAIKSYAITHGFVSNQALKVKCADDSLRDVWLTAVAVFDPENENQFTNLAIVLRANLPEKAGEEAPLTSEQERLTEYYLSKAGTHAKEEKEIIQDYYLEQIRLLYSIIHQFSGVKIADGLMEHLDQIAKNKGWQVSREEQEIAMPKENDVRSLVEATSTLLGAARQYAVGASSAGIVNEEIRRMDQDIKPEALRSLDQFGLRQLQVPA